MHIKTGLIHLISVSKHAPLSILRIKVKRVEWKRDWKMGDQKRTTQQLNSPVILASENPVWVNELCAVCYVDICRNIKNRSVSSMIHHRSVAFCTMKLIYSKPSKPAYMGVTLMALKPEFPWGKPKQTLD